VDWPGVGRQMALDDRPFLPPKAGFYLTDAIADYAVEFLREGLGARDPFFLYLAFTAPHFPIHAPAADIARHRGRYRRGWDALRATRYERMTRLGTADGASPLSPRDPGVPAWAEAPDPDLQDLRMAIFAAQVEVMDRGIGRVLAQVKAMEAEENTLFFFLSDHGACNAAVCAEREPRLNRPPYLGGPESFAPFGQAWANASNTPWREFKGTLWQGGLSIPMIAAGPAAIARPGGLCDQVGHQFDILPTILELTGAEYRPPRQGRTAPALEGVSLAPVLRGRRAIARDPLFWELEGARVVRDGDWKLVAPDEGAWELYDMTKDRSELRDLSGEEPKRVQRLADKHAAWAARCGVRPWSEMKPQLQNL
jgi:arylsulfatase A-like enzyme